MRAPETLFWTKDKQELVAAGDARARFFAYAEGQEMPDEFDGKIARTKKAPAPQQKIIRESPNKAKEE